MMILDPTHEDEVIQMLNLFQVGFLSGLSMFSPGQALLSIGDKRSAKIKKSYRFARYCHGGHGLPDS